MAGNTIKGLTVEIGGDTTELGKALENVEKRSRNLSSELGSINKLLRMDPGNVDLLAQKQKVLSDAVENTREKLDTLKEAEKQVQAQFERGEVSEAQVRELQREIIATTKKLESYEKAAQEAADAMKRLSDDTDEAGDDVKDTGDDAGKASKELDDLADSAKDAGDAGDGMGSKLAGAAKAGLGAIAAAAGAALGALVGCAEATREYRTEMGKLDTAFTTAGHSSEAATETYKTLQGVLGETDQAVEAANHLAQLAENEEDLATWTNIATGVYATFGASLPIEGLTEAANETAKTGALTGGLADALNWAGVSEEDFQAKLDACSTEQERQALITETLNGLYSEAADAYRETNAEIIRANEANEAWTASMAEIGGAVEPLITDVKSLGASMLSELVPGVVEVVEAFRGLVDGSEGAGDALGSALSGLISEVLGKVVDVVPAIAEVGMSLITELVDSITDMAPLILRAASDVVLTLIQGLSQAGPSLISNVLQLAYFIVDALVMAAPKLLQAATDFISNIAASLPDIIANVLEYVDTIIIDLVNGLFSPEVLTNLLAGIMGLINAILAQVPTILQTLLPMVPQIVTSLLTALAELTPQILDAALSIIVTLFTETLPAVLGELYMALPEILVAIRDGLAAVLGEIVMWFSDVLLPAVGEWLGGVWETVKAWGAELLTNAVKWLVSVADTIYNKLSPIPGKVWDAIKGAIDKVKTWGSNLWNKAKTAVTDTLNTVRSTLSALPGKVYDAIKGAVDKVGTWGSNMVNKAKTAMSNVVTAVKDKLKSLPDDVLSIGGDLVSGLWNGINDKLSWLKDKISGFTSSVLDSIKDFFGVHSPSTETAWVGDMLDQGLAEGMLDNINDPVNAMKRVTQGVLGAAQSVDGLSIDRQLSTTAATPSGAGADNTGLLAKLDGILAAIERGQVLAIDGDALVGATADKYDQELGRRRVLAARGA